MPGAIPILHLTVEGKSLQEQNRLHTVLREAPVASTRSSLLKLIAGST